MFTLQRRYLVQKIWRAREISIGDQVSAKAFGLLKEAVHHFLANLDLTTLRLLAKIVSEKNSDVCLHLEHLNKVEECVQRERYLIFRVWRWPDLKENIEVKHIADSSSEEEDMADCLCVNPFHFSRITKREIPYQGLHRKGTTQEDSGLSCGSADTEISSKDMVCEGLSCTKEEQRQKPWLTLAYWERNKRVGSMYYGYDSTINIYESNSKGHTPGLCLKELNRTCEMNDPTKIVFRNIGEGIQVSLEDGNIWIYNKSTSPVFLNGSLLQRLHHTDTPRVDKLPSGYGLMIFECNANVSNRQSLDNRREEPQCLRVSFVKGFGRGYKRQNIMNCPCWVEMFFSLPKS